MNDLFKRLVVLVLVFTSILACASTKESNMKLKIAETKKVLIIVTNHEDYPNREDKTGLWLTELTHFYEEVLKAGFRVDIASPKGGRTPLDERSLGWPDMDRQARNYMKDPLFVQLLDETLDVSTLEADDYIAIYFAGGHGTMWDFRDNNDLKKISEGIYNNEGYVTSVCHGAAGLLNLQLPDGTPLINSKKVTGFSNKEEWMAGLTDTVPFSLEDELKALGPKYVKALIPFVSFAISDGRFVTGQNPSSGKAVAKELLRIMKNREQRQE